MALRVASLDYLGTVAARLRKDAVTSKMDQRSIDRILGEVTLGSAHLLSLFAVNDADVNAAYGCDSQSSGSDEIQQLQKALLRYLEENMENDPSLVVRTIFSNACLN